MNRENGVLTAQQAAAALGVHVETVRRLARRGQIPSFKVGKDWRFHSEDLRRWAVTFNQRHRPLRILVVDDDAAIGRLITGILIPAGYQVLTASGGRDGLSLLAGQPADLIILDLLMPGMDGPAFLEQLRRRHPDVPVIILTGYPDGELMARAMIHGPLMLLAKPIDGDWLIRAVKTVLHGARSESMNADLILPAGR